MQQYEYRAMVSERIKMNVFVVVWLVIGVVNVFAFMFCIRHDWTSNIGSGVAAGVIALLTLFDFLIFFVVAGTWPSPAGMGLDFSYVVRANWEQICRTSGIFTTTPKISHYNGSRVNWSARVHVTLEQLAMLEKHVEQAAKAVGAQGLAYEHVLGGYIQVTVSRNRTIPSSVVLVSEKKEMINLDIPKDCLGAVSVAVTADGKPFHLTVYDNHILVVGASGAGKSVWIWSIIASLRDAIQCGKVKLYAADPKMVELNKGKMWFDTHATTRQSIIELIERFHADMMERAGVLSARGDDHYQLSPQEPLNILLVDELAFLLSPTNKKESDHMVAMLSDILRLGRALGFSVIGASQSIKAEAIPCKDDFITRVGLRMMSAQHTDMMLGAGAKEAGAECWKIDRETERGTAYVIGDDGRPIRVRARYYKADVLRLLGDNMRAAMANASVMSDGATETDEDYEEEEELLISGESEWDYRASLAKYIAGVTAEN